MGLHWNSVYMLPPYFFVWVDAPASVVQLYMWTNLAHRGIAAVLRCDEVGIRIARLAVTLLCWLAWSLFRTVLIRAFTTPRNKLVASVYWQKSV